MQGRRNWWESPPPPKDFVRSVALSQPGADHAYNIIQGFLALSYGNFITANSNTYCNFFKLSIYIWLMHFLLMRLFPRPKSHIRQEPSLLAPLDFRPSYGPGMQYKDSIQQSFLITSNNYFILPAYPSRIIGRFNTVEIKTLYITVLQHFNKIILILNSTYLCSVISKESNESNCMKTIFLTKNWSRGKSVATNLSTNLLVQHLGGHYNSSYIGLNVRFSSALLHLESEKKQNRL